MREEGSIGSIVEDVEVEAGGVTKGFDGDFLLSVIGGLSFLSGCVRGINSQMDLLVSHSVIGAENLEMH